MNSMNTARIAEGRCNGMAELNIEAVIKSGVEKALNKPIMNGKSITQWAAIGMKAPQWVSVEERLPEKNQIVIASDGEHTWDVGMYKGLCGKPSEWNWKKNTVKTVLWWMPKDGALPEPPKEEKPECD